MWRSTEKGSISEKIILKHKLFPLSTREMQFSWERIKEELKKCALVCCCCHREIHCGLVDSEQVKQVWKERWTKIEHQV